MSKHFSASCIAIAAAILPCAFPATAQVAAAFDAVITADNAYGLGIGPAAAVSTFLPTVFNTTAGGIFNCAGGPETYQVTGASVTDFVYLVCWSDDAVTQGVLGQFTAGANPTVYTGAGKWQVYATGLDFDGPGGPSLAEINNQIGLANNAAGAAATTSVTWVGTTPSAGAEGVLVFGEDNTTASGGTCANPFPIVCATSSGLPNAMDAAARWMWYQRPGSSCAFFEGNQREFLIFRLPLGEIVCPPAVAAAETPRLGTPPNPSGSFLPGQTSAPIVGAIWDPAVAPGFLAALFPGATAVLDIVAVSVTSANVPLPPFGTVLVGNDPLLFTTTAGTPFAIPVPKNCNLVGVSAAAQGASVGLGAGTPIVVGLANALDITIGAF